MARAAAPAEAVAAPSQALNSPAAQGVAETATSLLDEVVAGDPPEISGDQVPPQLGTYVISAQSKSGVRRLHRVRGMLIASKGAVWRFRNAGRFRTACNTF